MYLQKKPVSVVLFLMKKVTCLSQVNKSFTQIPISPIHRSHLKFLPNALHLKKL